MFSLVVGTSATERRVDNAENDGVTRTLGLLGGALTENPQIEATKTSVHGRRLLSEKPMRDAVIGYRGTVWRLIKVFEFYFRPKSFFAGDYEVLEWRSVVVRASDSRVLVLLVFRVVGLLCVNMFYHFIRLLMAVLVPVLLGPTPVRVIFAAPNMMSQRHVVSSPRLLVLRLTWRHR